MLTILIGNGKNYINVETSGFVGELEKAKEFIQTFCDKNKVSIKSLGYGYNDLIINDKTYDITPYGIDIKMMVEYCGGNPADFAIQKNEAQEAKFSQTPKK